MKAVGTSDVKDGIHRLTCVICPMGCAVEVQVKGGKVIEVRGCKCPRGRKWAVQEVLEPRRVVMSVIPVKGGDFPTVSVKTDRPVRKDQIPELMRYIAEMKVRPPVRVGEVLGEFKGIKIVATRWA